MIYTFFIQFHYSFLVQEYRRTIGTYHFIYERITNSFEFRRYLQYNMITLSYPLITITIN